MRAFSPLSLFSVVAAVFTLLLVLAPSQTSASPVTSVKRATSSNYWLANIKRQGSVAYGSDSSYAVYRNVMDYGAKGDGSTDDTAAINAAIAAGSRCGWGCDSSTVKPALVYFPPGTYMVSQPIVMLYYTQLVGDALNLPVLKATAGFQGMAVLDSDPYDSSGANMFTNQNNFFRQVRNFKIDLTGMPQTAGAGIHWQVAQATSLQNIVFNMIPGSASKQVGIFMDNGSGGFMSDLVFNGGNYGAFLGNQQFTSRNWTFNNCNTAIFMNWNWAWTLKSVSINNCGVGLDMSNGGSTNILIGSVILMDSKLANTPIGVKTSFTSNSAPATAGTLIIDNVDFSGSPIAVASADGSSILAGGKVVTSWGEGRQYAGTSGSRVQGPLAAPSKPAALLDASGKFFERSKPQYESLPASSFISVKSFGAKGDGVTDDTAAIQKAMAGTTSNQILYFDHGAYVVSKTINVPNKIKMTGEIWPLIMATGSFFADPSNPQPVFDIGKAGEAGAVEITDLMFETKGPAPGAIMLKWNMASAQGASGIWDAHVRIGGSAGTGLQSDKCSKNPSSTAVNTACEGAYMLFWAGTKSAGVYLENTWFWVADHELDLPDHNQINIYNGRGVYIESQGPVWLYGTSSEHNVFYNYEIRNAKNVFMGMIQSETPYFQSNPKAPAPFVPQRPSDPTFSICSSQNPSAPCYKSWGLRVIDSTNVFIHGLGLYSFFENYSQDCVATNNCQQNMIGLQGSNNNLNMYAVTTKASVNMITLDNGVAAALDADNRNVFGATVAYYRKGGSSARDCDDEDEEDDQ
ncbi:glucan 1,3-beta-glucosidase [Aureobasidium pullulans]|uniref:Glucan 1,3-beta-glucosidase n=1 Tax=Aureobasidium pullulans TaxID=5580 RepID=A0A4V4KY98_AURPU|nr:glucan 1,3-beta-glucosidase [Aureobasidium pullulans]